MHIGNRSSELFIDICLSTLVATKEKRRSQSKQTQETEAERAIEKSDNIIFRTFFRLLWYLTCGGNTLSGVTLSNHTGGYFVVVIVSTKSRQPWCDLLVTNLAMPFKKSPGRATLTLSSQLVEREESKPDTPTSYLSRIYGCTEQNN